MRSAFFVAIAFVCTSCGGQVDAQRSYTGSAQFSDGGNDAIGESSGRNDGGVSDTASDSGGVPAGPSELAPMAECSETDQPLVLALKGRPKVDLLSAGVDSVSDSLLELSRLQVNSDQYWDIDVSTEKLGRPLALGSYEAVKHRTEGPGQAGLLIEGPALHCEDMQGRFRISKLGLAGEQFWALVLDFEFLCDNGPNRVQLRGCYRDVSRPN